MRISAAVPRVTLRQNRPGNPMKRLLPLLAVLCLSLSTFAASRFGALSDAYDHPKVGASATVSNVDYSFGHLKLNLGAGSAAPVTAGSETIGGRPLIAESLPRLPFNSGQATALRRRRVRLCHAALSSTRIQMIRRTYSLESTEPVTTAPRHNFGRIGCTEAP